MSQPTWKMRKRGDTVKSAEGLELECDKEYGNELRFSCFEIHFVVRFMFRY